MCVCHGGFIEHSISVFVRLQLSALLLSNYIISLTVGCRCPGPRRSILAINRAENCLPPSLRVFISSSSSSHQKKGVRQEQESIFVYNGVRRVSHVFTESRKETLVPPQLTSLRAQVELLSPLLLLLLPPSDSFHSIWRTSFGRLCN